MANGSNSSDPVGTNGSVINKLNGALEQRLIQYILIAIFSGGITLGYNKADKDARAYLFTGTEGKKLAAEIAELKRDLDKLQQAQVLDDQHRRQSREGYKRIDVLEDKCSICSSKMEATERRLTQIETRVLFRHPSNQEYLNE